MKDALKEKSDTLADKMNKLTDTLTANLDLSEEMELSGDDIIEYVEEKTEEIKLETLPTNLTNSTNSTNSTLSSEIINLETMVQDFKYIRESLKENTDNGRRVLNSVTLELLDADGEKRSALIMSFAELNRAVAENMKLYVSAYKDISNVLLNINKIKQNEIGKTEESSDKNNTPISTVDLIQKLS